jgi:MFS superfamily sulfate permease-like transporter
MKDSKPTVREVIIGSITAGIIIAVLVNYIFIFADMRSKKGMVSATNGTQSVSLKDKSMANVFGQERMSRTSPPVVLVSADLNSFKSQVIRRRDEARRLAATTNFVDEFVHSKDGVINVGEGNK